ncbi:MAG TPA: hypothetical protein VEX17_00930, partial [Bacillales bacterium]|nr:hypothetical protein [Bacillales bacterium]
SPTTSTEVPLTDEQTSNSHLPSDSDLEKEKTRDRMHNSLTQRQLSNSDLLMAASGNSANKSTGIKMTDIPKHPNTNEESQKRTFNSTKDAFDDYVRFQTQAINSFQGALIPIIDTTTSMFLTNQTFWGRVLEIYSRSSTICTENTVALGKMMNEIATANVSALKGLFSIPKGT